MTVIEGVFGEAEILAMPVDTICQLGKLLDDKLSYMLLQYMNNPEANPEVVKKIDTYLGTRIRRNTFHLKIIEKGIVDVVMRLTLSNLPYAEVDLGELYSKLSFVVENKKYIKSNIEPRENADYKEFEKMIKQLQKDMIGKPREFNNLPERLNANKFAFCGSREHVRATRVGLLLSRMQEIEIAVQGLEYLQLTREEGIDNWVRREF